MKKTSKKTSRKSIRKKNCLRKSKKQTYKKYKKVKTIRLRNKRYKFLKTNLLPKDSWGVCTDPAFTKRVIKIHKSLNGIKEFEVIVHEMLHACFWDIDESVIREVGIDISHALWKLGYRK
jgi:hypothetical protein